MCGIAGAIGRIDSDIISAVDRMNLAQVHRGPDDEGNWKSGVDSSGNGVCFAFRRLAIIDLSPDANQPMLDPQTGNVIVFNGEIYNYRELWRELESEGIRFQTGSDTEVLLKVMSRWGRDAISRLRGMFAFAMWDATTRTVTLARDRLGIKPLYWCKVNASKHQTCILFASELRSLLASELVPRQLDPQAFSTNVWNGFVVGSTSIVKDINILPPATVATISLENIELATDKYWRLPSGGSHRLDGEDHLRDRLTSGIKQHLISDVPLGVFLSGGIDSTAIASLAASSGSSNIHTFTIRFDETEFDESQYASEVARQLGTEHSEITLDQASFRSSLHHALASLDQPTFDGINTYFISRAVREAGMTVALAGTGGDELFGGYRSFRDIPRASRMSRLIGWLPDIARGQLAKVITRIAFGKISDIPPQVRWGKIRDVLATRGSLIDLYQVSYGLFTQEFVDQLTTSRFDLPTFCGLPESRYRELEDLISGQPALHAISLLELSNFIGERLLRDTDCASMASSLEVRVPLLDHEVVEAAASIHPARRFHPLGQKSLLKKFAIDEKGIRLKNRPKSGFVLPIDRWSRNELQEEMTDLFNDKELCESIGFSHDVVKKLWKAYLDCAPGLYWSRVWSLYVLLWWCRHHRLVM